MDAMTCSPIEFGPILIGKLAGALFFSVLFVQSGLDKAINWDGNLKWITGYFSKTPLAKFSTVLLWTLTFLEIGAGLFSAAGAILVFFCCCYNYLYLGAMFSALSLIAVFFGQRITKDYGSAASTAGYFAAVIGWIIILCL